MVNLGTKYSVGFDTYIYADEAENFIIDFFDYYANKGYTAHNATDTAAKKMSLTDLSSYKVGKTFYNPNMVTQIKNLLIRRN